MAHACCERETGAASIYRECVSVLCVSERERKRKKLTTCTLQCVVYADSSSYTLPRDKCQPNHPVRSLPRPVEEDLHPGVDRKPTTGSEGLCSDCTARAPPTTPVSGTQSKRSSPVMTAGAAANTGAGLGAIALAAVVAVVVAHVDES